jgi:hypothetical protein
MRCRRRRRATITTAAPVSRATVLGITRAIIPAAAPYAIHSTNPTSRIVK